MNIIPASRIVLLKPAKLPDMEGKLMTVEKKQPEIGEVIAVGDAGFYDNGKPKHFPIMLNKGDIIAYRQYGQSKFYIEGEEKIFVGFDDILGVIKKGKKDDRRKS